MRSLVTNPNSSNQMSPPASKTPRLVLQAPRPKDSPTSAAWNETETTERLSSSCKQMIRRHQARLICRGITGKLKKKLRERLLNPASLQSTPTCTLSSPTPPLTRPVPPLNPRCFPHQNQPFSIKRSTTYLRRVSAKLSEILPTTANFWATFRYRI